MAEIRVEPKRRSLAWLWVLLALAVVALVAWYLLNGGVTTVNGADTGPATTSSLVRPLGPAGATSASALASPIAAAALAA